MGSNRLKNILRTGFSKQVVWLLLVIVFIIGALTSSSFLKPSNLINIINHSIPTAMMVFGMAFLLMIGRIDLSLESTFAFAPILAVLIVTQWVPGLPAFTAILLTFIIGIIIGAFNGFVSVKLGVNDFLVGLAMMLFLRGIVKFLIPEGLYGLPTSYTFLGSTRLFNRVLPLPIIVLIVVFVILYLLTRYSPFGRKILATGSNEEAAFVAGIDTNRVQIMVFILGSFFAALGGFISVGRQLACTNSMGDGVIIKVLAAVVLGGVNMDGGIGTMSGALAGAFLLQMIDNVLTLSGVNPLLLDAIFGFILLAAIILQGVRQNKLT